MASQRRQRDTRLHPKLWAAILLAIIVAYVAMTVSAFDDTFTPYVTVTLTSERAGLVMETGAKVKLRGVQVGTVTAITGGQQPTRLNLDIYPDQTQYIPANVDAQIRATSVFGAKYVDLVYPDDPSPQRLTAGAVLHSRNVTTEVNTVFQNLVGLLKQIDPAKLNAVLGALAEGVRGQGPTMGQAITDANQVLLALNPRSDTLRQDWRSFKGFNDAYSGAAQNILSVLDTATTTSDTITGHASALDALLINVTGLSQAGINLIGPNKDNLIHAVNGLEPTTDLLMKYDPEYTCLLMGAKWFLDNGGYDAAAGADGKSLIMDAGLLLGDDPYKYPDNLPITAAKGGPGGKPGCGSLPIVDNAWPLRQLVTNTGWGTGLDIRPNPGIGFPGWANYFPVTRAIPEPPSIRYPGGPAPGPVPYPGAPPYGAPQYGPDRAPLYPGVPPGPAPAPPPP